jgi:hypothetical protein
MFILVRALVASKDKGKVYDVCCKVFAMGTEIEVIRDYAASIICDNLCALEIKIIRDVDSLCPGIEQEIQERLEIAQVQLPL